MKNLHLFRFLFATMLVTAMTAFTSCSEDTDVDFDIPSVEVSVENITFDKNGGEQTFDITQTACGNSKVPKRKVG